MNRPKSAHKQPTQLENDERSAAQDAARQLERGGHLDVEVLDAALNDRVYPNLDAGVGDVVVVVLTRAGVEAEARVGLRQRRAA
ncbi:hypothetical protein E2542_SST09031 [Spatholobus suberectus]|nr:hypothetical protein E2542_SST09031 [Spatholobus suberectus]